MAKTATAVQAERAPETKATDALNPGVLIKPSSVSINDAGQMWRTILVRMPEGAVADDLRDPKIWRSVQSVPQAALLKLDRLMILGYDESWAAEALVKLATPTEAHLLILKNFGFLSVGERLFSDGTHEVFWNGAAYGVRRVSDKVQVATGFATEGLAIDELKRQYPRVVNR